MCEKCDKIDITMARYRRLSDQIADQQTHEAAKVLLAKLEAEKLSLHPRK
jgi:hypothetical protein